MLFSSLTFISPSLYFSFSFLQRIVCFIITNIVKACNLNSKHSVCSDHFLSWLSSFTFYLLVPPNCKHISTNHYLSFHFPSSSNAGVAVVCVCVCVFCQLRTFPHQLYCVILRFCNKSKEKWSFTQCYTISQYSWGKNENEHFFPVSLLNDLLYLLLSFS